MVSRQNQVFSLVAPGKTLHMELPDNLRCLFSATIEERGDDCVLKIPEEEVRLGNLQQGEVYRVAVLPSLSSGGEDDADPEPSREQEPQTPPVSEGEQRTVEIEDIGEQGDGITRVERGFVVIVPDTDQGERVTIEITDVRENVAFADVIERKSYYE